MRGKRERGREREGKRGERESEGVCVCLLREK
jgi:hypothetical protein